MSWGGANRPIVSNKIGIHLKEDGADGDIQIKGTGLGAKLFAKWSSRWWDVPLSIDGVTKIGTTDSDYLSIDRDSVDIYANSVKVATFGATTTVKDINLTGKIGLIGTDNNICSGEGNSDAGDDNISIGKNSGAALANSGDNNVLIGTDAGVKVNSGDNNVAIGINALKELTSNGNCVAIGSGALQNSTGSSNVGIGRSAGTDITTGTNNVAIGTETLENNVDVVGAIAIGQSAGGDYGSNGFMGNYSICIGTRADVGTDDDENSIVIGKYVVGKGSNTVVIGNDDVTDFYASEDSGATVHCTSLTLKETTTPTALADNGKLYTKNDNKLYFQDGAGTEHEISFA